MPFGQRHRVNGVVLVGVERLEDLPQQVEEHQPERERHGMEPTVEAAFAQGLDDVAVLKQENPGQFDFAAEETGSDQRHGHHLGAAHARLRVVLIAHGFEHIVTQAINEGNGILHGGLPVEELVARQSGDYSTAS